MLWVKKVVHSVLLFNIVLIFLSETKTEKKWKEGEKREKPLNNIARQNEKVSEE